MIRILGFLLGAALVAGPVGAWLAWSGRDEAPAPVAMVGSATSAPAPDAGPAGPGTTAKAPAPELPAPRPEAPPAEQAPPSSPAPPEKAPTPATGTEAEPWVAAAIEPAPTVADPASLPAPTPDELSPDGDDPAATEPPEPDGETPQPVAQAAVWQPFRSERAARGFADHLSGRYGADASVRRDGPGRYRVVVAAASPEALASELDRLRAESGLERLETGP